MNNILKEKISGLKCLVYKYCFLEENTGCEGGGGRVEKYE